MKQKIKKYRVRLGRQTGYVFHKGLYIYGWCAMLPPVNEWIPGTIASGPDGKGWIATGGDDESGAERWEPVVF